MQRKFAGFRIKTYSYLIDDSSEDKKAKGLKKVINKALKKVINKNKLIWKTQQGFKDTMVLLKKLPRFL